MLRKVTAVWTGLSPLYQKIIIYAVLSLAVLFALRQWGNKQWYKGEQQGRDSMAKELTKTKKAEWAIKDAEIKKAEDAVKLEKESVLGEKADVKLQKAVIAARNIELDNMRTANLALLSQVTAQSKIRKEITDANDAAIPASQLLSTLRRRSTELGPE